MHFLLGRYGYAHQIRPSISWEDWTAVPAPFVILDCICPPSSRSSSRLAPTRDFSRLLNAGLSCLCSYLALSVSLSPLAQKRKLLAPRPSVRPVPSRDTESEEENERIKSKARCLAPFYASTPTFFFFLFVRISKNLGVTHNLALALDDTFFFHSSPYSATMVVNSFHARSGSSTQLDTGDVHVCHICLKQFSRSKSAAFPKRRVDTLSAAKSRRAAAQHCDDRVADISGQRDRGSTGTTQKTM